MWFYNTYPFGDDGYGGQIFASKSGTFTVYMCTYSNDEATDFLIAEDGSIPTERIFNSING